VRSPPPAMPQQRSARTSDTVREERLRHEEGVGGQATLRATSATWTTALVVLGERGALGSTPDAQGGSRRDRTSVGTHSGRRERAQIFGVTRLTLHLARRATKGAPWICCGPSTAQAVRGTS
jgi:hypothetical protein